MGGRILIEAKAAEATDIWKDDLLGRKGDADFLQQYIARQVITRREEGRAGAFTINLDADWGAGKTFFVEHFSAQLESSGHIVARVNAWRDDHLDDPSVAVLASIDKALAPFVKKDGNLKNAWKAVKKGAAPALGKIASGVAKTVVRKYVGHEIGELLKADPDVAGDEDEKTFLEEIAKSGGERISIEVENVIDQSTQKFIDEFNAKGKAADAFQARLEKAIAAIGAAHPLPFYVIIDELDRCRPSYALTLLERVKHLFGATNIAFVFSTNASQLKHSISGQYGQGFDSFRYLKRFFDATYRLPNPDIGQFISIHANKAIKHDGFRAPGGNVEKFIRLCFDAYELKLRDIKRVLDIVETVAITWPNKNKIDLAILLPIAIHYYKNGDVSLHAASIDIPGTLDIVREKDPRSNLPSHTFNIRSLFGQFVGINSSKDNFRGILNVQDPDETLRYIRENFDMDWERIVNEGRKSSHNDLLSLVAHAGSIATG